VLLKQTRMQIRAIATVIRPSEIAFLAGLITVSFREADRTSGDACASGKAAE
jgi:hypothetical protein